jgi:hypothetical protein
VLADFGTGKFLIIAAWCLVLPAAYVSTRIASAVGNATGQPWLGAAGLIVGLAAVGWSLDLPRQCADRTGLEIGLNADREEIICALTEHTTTEARILWEDRPETTWTALLALRTDRAFLGGLDPEGRVEHMYARLSDGKLNGRPIEDATDAQLLEFFDRYNVGWVVCWKPESIQRLQKLKMARQVMELKDGKPGVLFALQRKANYFLKGRGQWTLADAQRIALADIVPEDGEVILSMHYQSNMRVSPGFVQIEREIDLADPIPFIRLRVPGPVARVSIVWDNP